MTKNTAHREHRRKFGLPAYLRLDMDLCQYRTGARYGQQLADLRNREQLTDASGWKP